MTTFVIVHGGFGGGWEWAPVARMLRGMGHEVYTPSLTGMGDRAHLASSQPTVGLSTHVADIAGILEFEDLHDVVLVGAGFGGVPVTNAADRVAHRVGLVVYIDALVPTDNEAALNLLPDEFTEAVLTGIEEEGESWRVPVPDRWLPPAGWGSDAERSAYSHRLRPHSALSLLEPVYLTGGVDHLPRAYVRCGPNEFWQNYGSDPVEPMVARAQKGFWHFRELDGTHDPHLSNPVAVAQVLLDLATTVLDARPVAAVPFPAQATGERESRAWIPA
jgi:pimeloyl-ACP methyl ester carboxylesterase